MMSTVTPASSRLLTDSRAWIQPAHGITGCCLTGLLLVYVQVRFVQADPVRFRGKVFMESRLAWYVAIDGPCGYDRVFAVAGQARHRATAFRAKASGETRRFRHVPSVERCLAPGPFQSSRGCDQHRRTPGAGGFSAAFAIAVAELVERGFYFEFDFAAKATAG